MGEILSILSLAVVKSVLAEAVKEAFKAAKDRERHGPELIELKLNRVAERKLPASFPPEERPAAIASLVEIARPTYEQILEYSPTAQGIMAAMKRAPSKRPTHTWHAAKKAVVKKSAKKSATKVHVHKKAAAVKHVIKKSAPVKSATKKVAAKKAAKKAPMRRL